MGVRDRVSPWGKEKSRGGKLGVPGGFQTLPGIGGDPTPSTSPGLPHPSVSAPSLGPGPVAAPKEATCQPAPELDPAGPRPSLSLNFI